MIEDLHDAVRTGDVAAISSIVTEDPTLLRARCRYGWTALIVAAYCGGLQSLGQLIKLGAEPDFSNTKGTTPLMYAKGHYLRTGDAEPMRILLRAGADPELTDNMGLRLIDYVPEERKVEVSAILLNRAAANE